MYRVNLTPHTQWTRCEVRALFVRHVVYSCAVVLVSWMILLFSRVYVGCRGDPAVSNKTGVGEYLSRCRSELNELDRAHRWLSGSLDSRRQPFQVLSSFEKAMPPDVWLRELVVSDDGIQTVGFAYSESSVDSLLHELSASGDISHLRLESSHLESGPASIVREFRISGSPAGHERVFEGKHAKDL